MSAPPSAEGLLKLINAANRIKGKSTTIKIVSREESERNGQSQKNTANRT